jgi:coenzyme F420-reducing hydrogenase alpha subunit
MADQDFSTMKTDVEILKKDVSNIQGLLGRLDTAIDKIADATGGISKILAVHDQALERVQDDIEERKRLAEKENELLHQRISDMKEESATHHRENHKAVMSKLDDMSNEVKDELKEVKERVTILERWKWWVMGGSWAIGFIIATILQAGGIVQLFTN